MSDATMGVSDRNMQRVHFVHTCNFNLRFLQMLHIESSFPWKQNSTLVNIPVSTLQKLRAGLHSAIYSTAQPCSQTALRPQFYWVASGHYWVDAAMAASA